MEPCLGAHFLVEICPARPYGHGFKKILRGFEICALSIAQVHPRNPPWILFFLRGFFGILRVRARALSPWIPRAAPRLAAGGAKPEEGRRYSRHRRANAPHLREHKAPLAGAALNALRPSTWKPETKPTYSARPPPLGAARTLPHALGSLLASTPAALPGQCVARTAAPQPAIAPAPRKTWGP
mgnify:CR=1 FL=1